MQGTLEKIEHREAVTLEHEGVKLFGVLHRPIDVDNAPIVVIMHGFASSKQGSNRCYVALSEALAKAGVASVRFDFRGCGDSEGSLSETGFADLVADGAAMCAFAEKIEGVDAARMGVFGASLGGAIAAELDRDVQAIALWAPVASGEIWFQDFVMNHPEVLELSDPREAIGTYRGVKVSPLFQAEFAQMTAFQSLAKRDAPLLHMHGEGDDVITIAHQEAYKSALGGRGTFIIYPDEAHSLGFAKVLDEAIDTSVAFFKENLA